MLRFTPTPVGNTRSATAASRLYAVHPHACGEYRLKKQRRGRVSGSPPRLWGIQHLRPTGRRAHRFTPTPVGNTRGIVQRDGAVTVHPHACGEYLTQLLRHRLVGGSPPRLWGIRRRRRPRDAKRRFTPTPVGNTEFWALPTLSVSVHPHACGEYSRPSSALGLLSGSPPRLWGIPALSPYMARCQRFTPTPVGNTIFSLSMLSLLTVHPHACGEYVTAGCRVRGLRGSPPRLWGIRYRFCSCARCLRFTPTPVGNTSLASRATPR